MSHNRNYYRQIAHLHAKGINKGFLSTLGEGFLALLYEAIDAAPEAVLLTEVKNGEVIGFVSGACALAPIYKTILMKWPRLIATLAPVLLNPKKLMKILELLWHSSKGSQPKIIRGEPLPEFELLSIAVDFEERRTGIAKRLYERLKQYSTENGISSFKIIVGEDLTAAHSFYLRMGANHVSDIHVHKDRKSFIYVQSNC